MAGYSGTPLPQKLGIRPGHRVAVLQASAGLDLGELPADVALVRSLRGKQPFDVILFFSDSRAEVERLFPALRERLAPTGGLWICWPKKASGLPTDLGENLIRAIGLSVGLVDNKVCAVDETWSGLRFVWRLSDRPRP